MLKIYQSKCHGALTDHDTSYCRICDTYSNDNVELLAFTREELRLETVEECKERIKENRIGLIFRDGEFVKGVFRLEWRGSEFTKIFDWYSPYNTRLELLPTDLFLALDSLKCLVGE